MAWSGSTFTRTNGTYSGATVWQSDYNNGQVISPARFDTHDQDLATGINACLNKNGLNTPTTNMNWGGYKITNLGNATTGTDVPNANQVLDPTSFTSTINPQGSSLMTYTGSSVLLAQYVTNPLAELITIMFSVTGNIGGTLNPNMEITLPYAAVANSQFGMGWIEVAGPAYFPAVLKPSSTTLTITKLDWAGAETNYTAAAHTLKGTYTYVKA